MSSPPLLSRLTLFAPIISLGWCVQLTPVTSAQVNSSAAQPPRVHVATATTSSGVGFTLYDSEEPASAPVAVSSRAANQPQPADRIPPTRPAHRSSGSPTLPAPIIEDIPEDVVFQFAVTAPPPPANRAVELLARPRETIEILPRSAGTNESHVRQASYAAETSLPGGPDQQPSDEPLALSPPETVAGQEPQETPEEVVQELANEIRHGTLSEIRFDRRERSGPTVPMAERYPERLAVPLVDAPSRQVTDRTYAWKATNLRYRRPYFEQVMLERHGLSLPPGRQWLASASRFYGTAMFLPVIVMFRPPGQLYDHRAFAHSGSPLSDAYLHGQFEGYEPLDPQATLTEPAPAEPVLPSLALPPVGGEPLEVIESLEAIEPPVMRDTLPSPTPSRFDANEDWED